MSSPSRRPPSKISYPFVPLPEDFGEKLAGAVQPATVLAVLLIAQRSWRQRSGSQPGVCAYPIAQLAETMRVSERQARYAIQEAAKCGLCEVESVNTKDGKENRYRWVQRLPDLEKKPLRTVTRAAEDTTPAEPEPVAAKLDCPLKIACPVDTLYEIDGVLTNDVREIKDLAGGVRQLAAGPLPASKNGDAQQHQVPANITEAGAPAQGCVDKNSRCCKSNDLSVGVRQPVAAPPLDPLRDVLREIFMDRERYPRLYMGALPDDQKLGAVVRELGNASLDQFAAVLIRRGQRIVKDGHYGLLVPFAQDAARSAPARKPPTEARPEAETAEGLAIDMQFVPEFPQHADAASSRARIDAAKREAPGLYLRAQELTASRAPKAAGGAK